MALQSRRLTRTNIIIIILSISIVILAKIHRLLTQTGDPNRADCLMRSLSSMLWGSLRIQWITGIALRSESERLSSRRASPMVRRCRRRLRRRHWQRMMPKIGRRTIRSSRRKCCHGYGSAYIGMIPSVASTKASPLLHEITAIRT